MSRNTQARSKAVVPATMDAALKTTSAWPITPILATTNAVRLRRRLCVAECPRVSFHDQPTTIAVYVPKTYGAHSVHAKTRLTAMPRIQGARKYNADVTCNRHFAHNNDFDSVPGSSSVLILSLHLIRTPRCLGSDPDPGRDPGCLHDPDPGPGSGRTLAQAQGIEPCP